MSGHSKLQATAQIRLLILVTSGYSDSLITFAFINLRRFSAITCFNSSLINLTAGVIVKFIEQGTMLNKVVCCEWSTVLFNVSGRCTNNMRNVAQFKTIHL